MLFYTINQLTTKWGKTEHDILQMILEGKMAWWLPRSTQILDSSPLKDNYEQIGSMVAKSFIIRPSTHFEVPSRKRTVDIDGKALSYWTEPDIYHLEDFVVFPEEVARVERELKIPIVADHSTRIAETEPHEPDKIDNPLNRDAPQTDTEPSAIVGRKEIEAYLGASWNTCKARMAKHGISQPTSGKWQLPWPIAVKIKADTGKK